MVQHEKSKKALKVYKHSPAVTASKKMDNASRNFFTASESFFTAIEKRITPTGKILTSNELFLHELKNPSDQSKCYMLQLKIWILEDKNILFYLL